jgi:hypothetical protein
MRAEVMLDIEHGAGALVAIEPNVPAVFTEALELAHDFAKAAKSAATQRAYSSDIAIFVEWCRGRGLNPLPASGEVVGAFLAAQAAHGKRPSTLGRRLAAIRYFHRAANEASPTSEESVKAVLAGIRRTVGAAPVRKKAATSDIVIAMAADAKSLRGFATARCYCWASPAPSGAPSSSRLMSRISRKRPKAC